MLYPCLRKGRTLCANVTCNVRAIASKHNSKKKQPERALPLHQTNQSQERLHNGRHRSYDNRSMAKLHFMHAIVTGNIQSVVHLRNGFKSKY